MHDKNETFLVNVWISSIGSSDVLHGYLEKHLGMETEWTRNYVILIRYRQTSNKNHTKSLNLNVSHLILHLPLSNLLKLGVKLWMKMLLSGDAPTTPEWSKFLLTTNVFYIKVYFFLGCAQYIISKQSYTCTGMAHFFAYNALLSYIFPTIHN